METAPLPFEEVSSVQRGSGVASIGVSGDRGGCMGEVRGGVWTVNGIAGGGRRGSFTGKDDLEPEMRVIRDNGRMAPHMAKVYGEERVVKRRRVTKGVGSEVYEMVRGPRIA